MAQYELVINPKTLYKIINSHAEIYDEEIEDFRIDLRKGVVRIQGNIRRGEAFSDKLLNLTRYVFSLKLILKNYDPTQQIVEFEVQSFEGKDQNSSIFNVLGSFYAISNLIKRETIKKICHPNTPYSHDKDFHIFYLDLKYYLTKMPHYLGKFKFTNIKIERRKLVFHCQSNIIIRWIMYFWAKNQSRVQIQSFFKN